jgi:putative restriction endonuclease
VESFTFDGRPMPLVERQRGIRKAAGYEAAISILTTYARHPDERPYDDGVGPDNYPRYKMRRGDPDSFDNRALRVAMDQRRPLIWFWGVAQSLFEAIYPVWIVGEERDQEQFVVAAPPTSPPAVVTPRSSCDRGCTSGSSGAGCSLRTARSARSVSSVMTSCWTRRTSGRTARAASRSSPTGVAMCVLHHKAFDKQVVGIRPDYVIQVRPDVLEEHDGPTLRHALQGLHQTGLRLPRQQAAYPDRDLLEERYERFRAAG